MSLENAMYLLRLIVSSSHRQWRTKSNRECSWLPLQWSLWNEVLVIVVVVVVVVVEVVVEVVVVLEVVVVVTLHDNEPWAMR